MKLRAPIRSGGVAGTKDIMLTGRTRKRKNAKLTACALHAASQGIMCSHAAMHAVCVDANMHENIVPGTAPIAHAANELSVLDQFGIFLAILSCPPPTSPLDYAGRKMEAR